MDCFSYSSGTLCCENVTAESVVTEVGTPLYLYSTRTIRHQFQAIKSAFCDRGIEPLVCYSVKANSNLAILSIFLEMGSGFDVVSLAELRRVIEVTGDLSRTVHAGVAKGDDEIALSLEERVMILNVESRGELERVSRTAGNLGCEAPVALRVNPSVDAGAHEYIRTGRLGDKFGIPLAEIDDAIAAVDNLPAVSLRGLHVHVGSQITDPQPHSQGARTLLDIIDRNGARTGSCDWIDIGGGFAAHYRGEEPLPVAAYAEAIAPLFAGRPQRLIVEPGRFIMANAGVLLTRVVEMKRSGERTLVICDAGMNDLLRPALYQAWHRIVPVTGDGTSAAEGISDVVGPLCESGDFLGLSRDLPGVSCGDLLAVHGAGAYGASMASNYNSRPRAAEVLVDGDRWRLVRRRETYDDLVRIERELS